MLQQLQTRLEKQLEARDQAAKAQKNAEDALDTQRRSIADLETRRKLAQDERGRAEAERARLAAQLEVLEQAERSLSGLANGAKFLLEEARRGRLKGGFQPLGGQQSPCGVRVCRSRRMGKYLDGEIVDTGEDIESP